VIWSYFLKKYPLCIFQNDQQFNILQTKEFSGKVAHKDSAIRSRVSVLRSVDDIPKMKQGNILVSPMTTPNFSSAIKKASAIITDEGGMLCHASIIARERLC